jgi:hypothetical protein
VLSVSVEADNFERAISFWKVVLAASDPAKLTWGDGSGSAFFEMDDGIRLIVNTPRRTPGIPAWLGIELFAADPEAERERLRDSGLRVSEMYKTDGRSDAFVVTTPEGQKFRIGSRWQLPTIDRHVTAGPREWRMSSDA